ncbi:50S ribosomal protein L15 [Candidatus Daviesbacteria bacterium]|nr:50S ribosomal protein L15 [Candidatus Daviesbacteria bacterium]
MKLHKLIKINLKSRKRMGRGVGSGRGKTAGRGTKGQKARGKIPATFTGSMPFYKKLPLKRGFGNLKTLLKPKVVSLSQLNVFPARATIDMEQLVKAKVVSEKEMTAGVKILGNGQLEKALTVKVPVSKSVRATIEDKGGKVENV